MIIEMTMLAVTYFLVTKFKWKIKDAQHRGAAWTPYPSPSRFNVDPVGMQPNWGEIRLLSFPWVTTATRHIQLYCPDVWHWQPVLRLRFLQLVSPKFHTTLQHLGPFPWSPITTLFTAKKIKSCKIYHKKLLRVSLYSCCLSNKVHLWRKHCHESNLVKVFFSFCFEASVRFIYNLGMD